MTTKKGEHKKSQLRQNGGHAGNLEISFGDHHFQVPLLKFRGV